MKTSDYDSAPPKVAAAFLFVVILARIALLLFVTSLLDTGLIRPSFPGAVDAATAQIMLIVMLLFWVQLILLVIWTAKANRALQDKVRFGLKTNPAMAGAGYIIPILSLWKPYFTMREIYKASRSPSTWINDGRTAIVAWWWIITLVSGPLGCMATFWYVQIGSVMPYGATVLHGLLLVKLVLLIVIVMRIMAWLRHGGEKSNADKVF